ncbi:hypothetical protein [Vulcanisaeta distributa]|uniref:hypothetical protein n=1 Tax=Vulcanisaeta distributa TaxID=164451 RepID=UPI001FB446EF|nr:hypothetical protein [Vulcanisaeta distributa]
MSAFIDALAILIVIVIIALITDAAIMYVSRDLPQETQIYLSSRGMRLAIHRLVRLGMSSQYSTWASY